MVPEPIETRAAVRRKSRRWFMAESRNGGGGKQADVRSDAVGQRPDAGLPRSEVRGFGVALGRLSRGRTDSAGTASAEELRSGPSGGNLAKPDGPHPVSAAPELLGTGRPYAN